MFYQDAMKMKGITCVTAPSPNLVKVTMGKISFLIKMYTKFEQ